MSKQDIQAKIDELEERLDSLDEMDYQSAEVISYELEILYMELESS